HAGRAARVGVPPYAVSGHRDRWRKLLGRRLFGQSHHHAAGAGVPLPGYDSRSDQSGRAAGIAALCPRHSQPAQRGLVQCRAAKRVAHDRLAAPGRTAAQFRERQMGGYAHPPHLQRRDGRARLFFEAQRRVGIPVHVARRGPPARRGIPAPPPRPSGPTLPPRPRRVAQGRVNTMGLIGILLGLALLIWLALRGWSVLLLAPAAALLAAAFALEPLLANWTQTFMGSAATFLAQFFPLFLLGALFGKLMDDSGCVSAIAGFMTERLGERRAVLAVVLAGALVTYGGVSLFVAFFVLVPMAQALFRSASIPRRLMPAAIM